MKSQSISNTDIIISEINNIIAGKSIADVINYETDNIYNKSATSVIVKKNILTKTVYII